jgi:hypothetical protein
LYVEDLKRGTNKDIGPKDIFEMASRSKGFDPETWRYRSGAWRFFYEEEVLTKEDLSGVDLTNKDLSSVASA